MTPPCPAKKRKRTPKRQLCWRPRPTSHTSLIISGRIATKEVGAGAHLTLDSTRLLKSLLFLEFTRGIIPDRTNHAAAISFHCKGDCAIEDASIWRGRGNGREGDGRSNTEKRGRWLVISGLNFEFGR